jgi:hypothetical protein
MCCVCHNITLLSSNRVWGLKRNKLCVSRTCMPTKNIHTLLWPPHQRRCLHRVGRISVLRTSQLPCTALCLSYGRHAQSVFVYASMLWMAPHICRPPACRAAACLCALSGLIHRLIRVNRTLRFWLVPGVFVGATGGASGASTQLRASV